LIVLNSNNAIAQRKEKLRSQRQELVPQDDPKSKRGYATDNAASANEAKAVNEKAIKRALDNELRRRAFTTDSSKLDQRRLLMDTYRNTTC